MRKENLRGKKCAIVNYWWADGHGAALTAFALSRLLSEEGFSPCLIKTTIGISGEECEKGRNFQFIHKFVSCTRKNYLTYKDYRELNKEYDHFILGSDQVFCLQWIPDEWYFYAIDYKKNIIAVAASFGSNEIKNSKSRIQGIGRYLSRFNAISLRELDGVDVYQKYFKARNDLVVILDPVFLVSPKVYEQVMPENVDKPDEEFIFFYFLDTVEGTYYLEEKIKKKFKTKIIKESSDLSIEDFLFYIKYSKMVVTDSFHGTCFAIIFNKPFYCVYNEERGVSRIKSLIEIFKLSSDMFLHYDNLESFTMDIPQINYEAVNQKIEQEQKRGRDWIKSKLSNPEKKAFKIELLDKMDVLKIHFVNRMVGRWLKYKKQAVKK